MTNPKFLWRPFGLALLAFLLTASISLFFFFDYQKVQKRIYYQRLTDRAESVGKECTEKVQGALRDLQNLKSRIEVTNGQFFKHWAYDASLILDQNEAFLFVEYIDSSLVIRKVHPLEGNEPAVGLDISAYGERTKDWLKAGRDTLTNVTGWLTLSQGGQAFLVDAPLHYQNTFKGSITGGLNFNTSFKQLLGNQYSDYAFEFTDHNGQVFYTYNQPDTTAFTKEQISETEIPLGIALGKSWFMKAMPAHPNPSYFNASRLYAALGFALSISLIMALFVYYFLAQRWQARHIQLINKEQRVLNEQLMLEKQKALKASEAKSAFLANMSHEIRTPLNALIGFIELLKQEGVAAAQEEYLRLMHFSSKNLLGLVNDILDFEQIESGKMALKEEAFMPAELLREALELYRPDIAKKNLLLNTEHKGGPFRKVTGDSGKYLQIITNVLRNAIKFTESGSITVRYHEIVNEPMVRVHIEIEDTGIGIDPGAQDRIFERFEQGDEGLTKRYEGSGLGLTISKQLTSLMGAQLKLVSSSKNGSAFSIDFSFEPVTPSGEMPVSPEKNRPSIAQARVLIVEDNLLNVTILDLILKKWGIEAVKAENGQKAMQLFSTGHFDLILMDLHMPVIDGFSATEEIRSVNSHVLIFGCTANVTPEAEARAFEVGMNEYLTKPIDKNKLGALLEKYFEMP